MVRGGQPGNAVSDATVAPSAEVESRSGAIATVSHRPTPVWDFPTHLPHYPEAMRPFPTLQAGAILAALAVALGAFGAHALRARLEPAMLATVETGARYLMYAALALIALGRQVSRPRGPLCLMVGALIFCGSLLLLAVTGLTWLGAVTPIGGALLIVGFVLAAVDARTPVQ